ncbi:MAG: SGNH/GDSL hydrolase family protein, partial [Acidobacteriaceae bacterium]|nr:SGNH/GDSL hydrolase family protein [Acidobacteriaceae bacterium]
MCISFKQLLTGSLLLFVSVYPTIAQNHWVGSWAASQQLVEPNNSIPADDLRDATLRQVVHLSIGGAEIRLHLSNRFGTAPLHFTSVHVARLASSAPEQIDPATDKSVRFSGQPDATVPAGADYVSDPIRFPVPALANLTVTLHIDSVPAAQTGHPGSRATSYLAHGDLVSATELPNAQKFEHWYFLAGVDVAAPPPSGSIVALGDSITDGHGATTDANNRWPDVLARRLQSNPATQGIAVLNQGI